MKADVTAENKLYPQENHVNTATDVYAKTLLTKIKVVFNSAPYFFVKSRSYSSASCWNLSQDSTRVLLEVPRRFRKRDGDALSIASSELENKNAVSQSPGTGCQLDAHFWTDSRFPHGVLREQGRGLKRGSCLTAYGKRREHRASSGEQMAEDKDDGGNQSHSELITYGGQC